MPFAIGWVPLPRRGGAALRLLVERSDTADVLSHLLFGDLRVARLDRRDDALMVHPDLFPELRRLAPRSVSGTGGEEDRWDQELQHGVAATVRDMEVEPKAELLLGVIVVGARRQR